MFLGPENMPTYCFSADDGVVVERQFPIGKAPSFIVLDDDRIAVRDYRPTTSHRPGSGWPMPPCIGSGVHPSQAQELRDFLAKAGCPTEVTGGGNPIYRNASHQKQALAARGIVNKSSFC